MSSRTGWQTPADAPFTAPARAGRQALLTFRIGRIGAFLTAALLLAGPAAQASPPSEAEQALLAAVNEFRARHGLPGWPADAELHAVARRHSEAMAQRGRLSHDGFTARAQSTGARHCVENLVAGGGPSDAVSLWQRSPSHRAALLDVQSSRAGTGIVDGFGTLLACSPRR